MRDKKNAAPVMLIPQGSKPTYGRKHPEDITGLTRTSIIFNIFQLSTSRGKNRYEGMDKSNNVRPGTNAQGNVQFVPILSIYQRLPVGIMRVIKARSAVGARRAVPHFGLCPMSCRAQGRACPTVQGRE
jgi:hypothetical protein